MQLPALARGATPTHAKRQGGHDAKGRVDSQVVVNLQNDGGQRGGVVNPLAINCSTEQECRGSRQITTLEDLDGGGTSSGRQQWRPAGAASSGGQQRRLLRRPAALQRRPVAWPA
jgi:hypothetical protein